jgi:putative NADH-flavin reductase
VKLVIFGATGGTGKQLVERALAAGHDVTAAARRPEAIETKHDKLRVVKADVLDPAQVADAIAGAEVVLSAIGPANNKKPGTLMSEGTRHMLAGCQQHGVRKFVFESGLMVGDGRGLGPFAKMAVGTFRWLNKALTAEKRIAEAAIRESGLDWVIVRPGNLDHSPPTGKYKTGVDLRINPAKKLSHSDVAAFMLTAAGDPALVHTVQDIGY